MASHTMSLRLDPDLAADLATVAAADGKPVTDVIRKAITDHIAARKTDPAFKASLREQVDRARRLLGDDNGGA